MAAPEIVPPPGTPAKPISRPAVALTAVGVAMAGAAALNMARSRFQSLTEPDPVTFAPLPPDGPRLQAARLALNRVAFGPRPGDLARVAKMGAPAWIEEQLADRMAEDPAVNWRIRGIDTHEMEENQPDVLASIDYEQLERETAQAALIRAIYSRHALRETIADFWTNHFNIYALKNDSSALIPSDTERVLRPHLLGKFREMLFASAHSPAMLAYLDNNHNQKRDPRTGGGANENYARELLELHTLGVRSGYTQTDIQAVARCFTGWAVRDRWEWGKFAYDSSRHDDGRKTIPFLGLDLAPGGGERDAETVLHRLATHPATARFLATKLCRRYLGATPEPIVQRAASAYLRSDTDIRAMLHPILLDGLADPQSVQPLMKRPLDLTASALRAIGADSDGGEGVQRHVTAMGQPLYQWPMPDGFPEKASAWTASLLPRWNFCTALAANGIDGTRVDLTAPVAAAGAHSDDEIVDALITAIVGRHPASPEMAATRDQLRRHLAAGRKSEVRDTALVAETAGLVFASPAFQLK